MTSWLAANNLTATTSSPAGDWITVQIPISKANALLEADYQTFSMFIQYRWCLSADGFYFYPDHTASGKQSFRTLSYALPVNLAQHIDAIHPTTSFNNPVPDSRPVISAHRSKAKTTANPTVSTDAVPASCAKTITPGKGILFFLNRKADLNRLSSLCTGFIWSPHYPRYSVQQHARRLRFHRSICSSFRPANLPF